MKRPPRLAHQPSLDGLRGVAVLAVLLYHGGAAVARGGFLGVEAFFVLSGYLITSLLLVEWEGTATIRLRAFWARRARRLLPALICMVTVVGIFQALAGPAAAVPGLRGDGFAALFYVGNWHQISAGSNYFVANGPVSPLQHTWSLAIEEQFYLVWPLAVLGLLGLIRARIGLAPGRAISVLGSVALVGALAASVETAVLYAGGSGLNRVYYGTDTRATGLLVGAGLACLMARRARRRHAHRRERTRRWAGLAGLAAAAALLGACVAARGSSGWLFHGGLLGFDVGVAVVIAVATSDRASLVGRLLSSRPLRGVGVVSYGLYVWHFPLFLWLDEDRTGLSGTRLLLLRLAVSSAVAIVSYYVVEQPIRRQRVSATVRRLLLPAGLTGAVASLTAASSIAAAAVAATPAPPAPGAPAIPAAPGPATGPPPSAGGGGGTAIAADRPSCQVRLQDTADYRVAPLPAYADPARGLTGPSRRAVQRTFHTCPPTRVLLVGDSLAASLDFGMPDVEQGYGVELAAAPILGCAFVTRDPIEQGGVTQRLPAGCASQLAQWRRDELDFHAQAVIVELGWRDEWDRIEGGRVVHLGQPGYDAELENAIGRLAATLDRGGIPVIFLTVPLAHPADLANGAAPPQASAARHALINRMLAAVAAAHPGVVRVVPIDEYVSPGGRYAAGIDGHLCRFDGLHFTRYCGQLLAPHVLAVARGAVG